MLFSDMIALCTSDNESPSKDIQIVCKKKLKFDNDDKFNDVHAPVYEFFLPKYSCNMLHYYWHTYMINICACMH